jgi:Zn finger protein HypA/HybF involved in hydrogenase expression
MDRVVVKCPHCGLGHRLPAASQGEVTCQKCGELFHADTRQFADTIDETVRDIGLAPFHDTPRDLSFGLRPPPVPSRIEGGGLKALVGARKSACPHCQHVMSVGLGEAQCPHCDHYSMPRDGYLHPIPEDYVAPSAVFVVPMGVFDRGEAPAICCACGEPATRTIKVGSWALVPHCQRHSVGAGLHTDDNRFGVRVQAHRFYCAAMLLGGGSARF